MAGALLSHDNSDECDKLETILGLCSEAEGNDWHEDDISAIAQELGLLGHSAQSNDLDHVNEEFAADSARKLLSLGRYRSDANVQETLNQLDDELDSTNAGTDDDGKTSDNDDDDGTLVLNGLTLDEHEVDEVDEVDQCTDEPPAQNPKMYAL